MLANLDQKLPLTRPSFNIQKKSNQLEQKECIYSRFGTWKTEANIFL